MRNALANVSNKLDQANHELQELSQQRLKCEVALAPARIEAARATHLESQLLVERYASLY